MSFNYDSYMIAREKLIEAISIPDYYMDYVSEEIDLDFRVKDCCPLHGEDTPSFFYIPERKMFHCFGCDTKGSVVDLHYRLELKKNPNYKKSRAVLDLAKMYEVEIPNIFKGAQLEDLKKTVDLGSDGRLKARVRGSVVKPRKKVESDFERDLIGYRKLLTVEEYRRVAGRVDEIFFLGADVDAELKVLRAEVVELVRDRS